MRLRPPALRPAARPRSCSAGFTLIEVALAAFVMALGIATSIIAMQSGFRFLDVARDTTLASQIMQSEIERIRMMSWASVTALDTERDSNPERTPDKVDLTTMFTSDMNLATRFTVTRTILRDSTRPNDVRFITVNVTWNSYDGRPHARRFQATYVKNGLYDYYYTLARP